LRILIIVVICVMLFFILRYQFRQNPKSFTRHFFFALIGLFTLLLFALAITGRLHWLFALLAGLLPWMRRLLPLLRFVPLAQLARRYLNVGGMRSMGSKPKGGQTSNVHSLFLSMTLNHDNGEISGEVLKGQFIGCPLRELTVQQLQNLLKECQADRDSYALLCSYLNYRFGSDWQTQFDGSEQATGEADDTSDQAMNYEEALDILGLQEPVSKADIIKAHRSMMQKFHPDRGGSNYLAAKINEAKEYLLKHFQD